MKISAIYYFDIFLASSHVRYTLQDKPHCISACIWFQEVIMRYWYSVIFLLVITTGCYSQILHVIEGDSAKLDFPYPCGISRVTLQVSNGAPFYSSAKSIIMPLKQRERFRVQNNNESNHCALNLTINPVSRNDQGTYICFMYDDDNSSKMKRTGLRIKVPPGRASCNLTKELTVENWATLCCTAPVGNMPGKIECYQGGIRIPPLTVPTETQGQLMQNILVQKNDYTVFCCSSPLVRSKDRCECNDVKLDQLNPETTLNTEMDPCPTTTQMQTQIKTSEFSFPVSESNLIHKITTETMILKMTNSRYIVSIILIVLGALMVLVAIINIVLIYMYKKHYDEVPVRPSSEDLEEQTKV